MHRNLQLPMTAKPVMGHLASLYHFQQHPWEIDSAQARRMGSGGVGSLTQNVKTT